jgi:hypothetical protein
MDKDLNIKSKNSEFLESNVENILDVELKTDLLSQTSVVHVYNPSYSGGRDQEDLGSKSAPANIPKIPNTKKGWWCGSSCRVPA